MHVCMYISNDIFMDVFLYQVCWECIPPHWCSQIWKTNCIWNHAWLWEANSVSNIYSKSILKFTYYSSTHTQQYWSVYAAHYLLATPTILLLLLQKDMFRWSYSMCHLLHNTDCLSVFRVVFIWTSWLNPMNLWKHFTLELLLLQIESRC